MVIVICGPIASGKSTVARAVARSFEHLGTQAAVADLDLVYEMLEHDRPAKDRIEKWSRARRAAAALTDGLLDDGIGVVVVEGDFLTQEERAEFLTALRSRVAPLFVTVHVSIDLALQRVQQDPSRGISRDPGFLRRHYEQLEEAVRGCPRQISSSIPVRSTSMKLRGRLSSGRPTARARANPSAPRCHDDVAMHRRPETCPSLPAPSMVFPGRPAASTRSPSGSRGRDQGSALR